MWAVMCCKEKGSTKEQRETVEWSGWIINANRLIAMWNELAYSFTIHCPSWLLLNWKLYPKDWACPKERRQQFFWTGPVDSRNEREESMWPPRANRCDEVMTLPGLQKGQSSAHTVQRYKEKERRGKKKSPFKFSFVPDSSVICEEYAPAFSESFLEGEFTNLLMKQCFAIEPPIALHSEGFLPPLFKTL